MLSDGTWSYTWKHGRQLASMSDGTSNWTFTYNADDLRIGKTNGSSTYQYYYRGSQLGVMTVDGNTLCFGYDAAGTPVSVLYNGVYYYYVTNLQGDVIAIVDGGGNVVAGYIYDAWGNILHTSGSMASTLGVQNPLRYRGYVYDQETGLYYLQSRYYNPEMGRFINADAYTSTGQGILGNNMFAYCGNNPTNNVDYLGNRYCAAITISGETSDERGISCRWQKYVQLDNPTLLDRYEVIGVKFLPDSSGNGGQIVNSYKINDSLKMTEYAQYLLYKSKYRSYFSGSIEGFLFEWDVHNIAFRLYTDLGDVTNANRAKSLDVGRTIYEDNHGFFTYMMLRAYELLYPVSSKEDFTKHLLLTG